MVSQSELRDVPPWLPEHFVGGHPALDFVNTVSHRADPERALDRFDTLEKVAGWCAFAGLVDRHAAQILQATPEPEATDLIAQLKELRGQAGLIFDAIADAGTIPGGALSRVMELAADNIHELELVVDEDGLRYNAPRPLTSADAIVGLMAMHVVDALYRIPPRRLKACPGCRWLFFDQSRPGRRKWCAMRDCGNRAKAQRHYRRNKMTRR